MKYIVTYPTAQWNSARVMCGINTYRTKRTYAGTTTSSRTFTSMEDAISFVQTHADNAQELSLPHNTPHGTDYTDALRTKRPVHIYEFKISLSAN